MQFSAYCVYHRVVRVPGVKGASEFFLACVCVCVSVLLVPLWQAVSSLWWMGIKGKLGMLGEQGRSRLQDMGHHYTRLRNVSVIVFTA